MKQKKYKPKHYMKKTKRDIANDFIHFVICALAIINCICLVAIVIVGAALIVAPYEDKMQESEDTEIASADVIIDLNSDEHIVIQKVKINKE